ncbi:hypothetical protein Acsp01_45220 [Actinoplanes sp. NBRC 101535]|nr:hypothetical protein Acsp01_45220 [Actinoplanes sp. NBRC 101535]
MPAAPSWRPGRRLVVGASIALALVAGGTTGAAYYYDSVPLVESAVGYPVVTVSDDAAHAFVAAVDPDFYASNDSLITRRYVVLAAGAGEESSLRARIMARKAESAYTKVEILDRFLNRADYGRGATGLVAAAQVYFQKAPEQLTVAEAAFLAVQLDPAATDQQAAWNAVLDTMVDLGWLTAADRGGQAFPG